MGMSLTTCTSTFKQGTSLKINTGQSPSIPTAQKCFMQGKWTKVDFNSKNDSIVHTLQRS